MKTDDLISMLATNVAPVDPHAAAKRLGLALMLGILGSMMLMSMHFGVRPDLAAIAATPLFWAKLAFPLALAAAALSMAHRLGHPGQAPGRISWFALAAPICIVWLATLLILRDAPQEARLQLLLGSTWHVCAYNIALLSIPAFIASLWAMKGLAPTRPRLAGGVSGLLAGAIATIVYSLHCSEMGVPFWATWYLLGMLMPAAAGALAGRALLRW